MFTNQPICVPPYVDITQGRSWQSCSLPPPSPLQVIVVTHGCPNPTLRIFNLALVLSRLVLSLNAAGKDLYPPPSALDLLDLDGLYDVCPYVLQTVVRDLESTEVGDAHIYADKTHTCPNNPPSHILTLFHYHCNHAAIINTNTTPPTSPPSIFYLYQQYQHHHHYYHHHTNTIITAITTVIIRWARTWSSRSLPSSPTKSTGSMFTSSARERRRSSR